MASAITLEGIDKTILNLRYKNKNTLKYRFVQHVRQYYTSENSVELLNEIDHEELIKVLWDTDHSLDSIKNKRKNLNSVRSSVNADFKKLYEKGENPEGIKIGSSNIFVMSEDAKDKILKKIGYDLQPDGTLKLDQIMDILKLANETVSGSMAVEDTEKKDGLKKIDRLKDLIKGLSEKVGLGSPQLSNASPDAGDMAGKGGEAATGSVEMAEVFEDSGLDIVEAVEDIEDLEDVDEQEILDDTEEVEIDEVAALGADDLLAASEIDEDVNEEEILDDIEEVEIDEVAALGTDDLLATSEIDEDVVEEKILDDIEEVDIDEVAASGTDDLLTVSEIDEDVEEVLDAEDTALEYVEDIDDVEAMLAGDISEEQAGESGLGDKDGFDGIDLGQDSGQEATETDIGGDEVLSKDGGTGLEPGEKEYGEGVGHDMAGKGGEAATGSVEMAEVFEDSGLDIVEAVEDIEDLEDVDEQEILDDTEEVEIDEVAASGADDLLAASEIDEDVNEEEILDDIEEVEIDEVAALGTDDLLATSEIDEDVVEEKILDDIEEVDIDEVADSGTDDLLTVSEIDEDVEEVLDAEDTALEYVEDIDDVEAMLAGDISEEQAGESGLGDKDGFDGIDLGQDSGQEATGTDIGGDEVLSKDGGTGLEPGEKEYGEGVGHDMAENAEDIFEVGKDQKGKEQLGHPVDALGQQYSIEADSKIKKDKLLAEEFDGYLGSMDRYYNHYILIPSGEYIIGSKHPKKDEKPEQMVYLKPFYFGRFPITNGLFEIFVEKTGYKTTAEKFGYGTVYYGRFEKKKDEKTGLITSTWNSSLYCKTVEGACWYRPSGPKSTLYNKRNHPVVQISMEDAMAFAAWTGKRLPTENEWEAASRTENGWMFPWGQKWKKDACNIEDSCTADTTPVDKYVEFENDFGIVDAIGNVLEWTNDSFDSTSKKDNGAKYRAVRGGSWISGNDIRLFSRFMIEPESHSNILGFRCVAY